MTMNRRFPLLVAVPLVFLFSMAPMKCAAAPSGAKVRWMAYKSNLLNLQVAVPADWSPVKTPHALAFRYDDLTGGTAAIGIMKSSQEGTTIEQAADAESEKEGRPTDWVRTPATVDGMRAL